MRKLIIMIIMTLLTLSNAVFADKSSDQNKILIQFGNSTVERYAAEELQRYLLRVVSKEIMLRDSTVSAWEPDHLTLFYPRAVEKAQSNIEARAKNPNMQDQEAEGESKKITSEESNLPAFILGTPETFPEYKKQIIKFLVNIRSNSDGYAIVPSKDGKKMFIVSYSPRGVLYGVYDFLQNKCGMGFFEDGEQIPQKINDNILPPYKKLPTSVLQEPKFDYRSKWIWSRYYGSDKGHPANWGYNQWVSHLRWMAQNRFSSVLIYAVGYTRIWGDVFKKAFPETKPFYNEVNNNINDFWGAHWSARAGWGRSPEETTRLMKKVYAFAREKLGMKIEYNFYLGDFEESLKKAYPQGKWIGWENVPSHTYFGAAGRQATLSFTDPKCKTFCQRLWKEFIKTFATDHRYWISYREESMPDSNNSLDPDQGKSLADAVNTEQKWILELDPKAEFFHWDWHGGWLSQKIYEYIKTNKLEDLEELKDIPLKLLERSAQKYAYEISSNITMVSIIPQLTNGRNIVKLTHHYKPHPWVIGSVLGYAGQDIGVGGLSIPVDKFFKTWQKWVDEDDKYGSRLRGVIHWYEIVQVSPLIDYCVANFAWTGKLPQHFTDYTKDDKILDWYFEHRFNKKNAKLFRKANAFVYANFPQNVTSMRIPTHYFQAGINESEKNQRAKLIGFLKKIVAVKNTEKNNDAYNAEIVDFGRIALHNIARFDLQEAIGIAKNSKGTEEDKKKFDAAAKKAVNALSALGDLLATDKKFSVSYSIYKMENEPGANKLLRQMLLEHASGFLFDNYALNDSVEFIKIVSVPLLKSYLKVLKMTVENPEKFPFDDYKKVEFIDGMAIMRKDGLKDVDIEDEEMSTLDKRLLELKNEFMNISGQPFSIVKNKIHPADVIDNWLKGKNKNKI